MTSVASPPFSRPDASFILRSSDLVDFRVHQEILSIASSVFEGMLAIPQPSQDSSQNLPILSVPEDSQTLDGLLRLIYPVERKRLTTVEAVGKVLEASIKYEIDSATTQMTALLKRFSGTKPLLTYIIACRLELEEVARLAAVRNSELHRLIRGSHGFISRPRGIYIEEMSQISAACYFQLLKFLSPQTSARERAEIKFVHHPLAPSPIVHSQSTPQFDIGPWSDVPPDIIVRSIDGAEFQAHKQMLSTASPILAREIRTAFIDRDHGLPVVTLVEEHALLMKLILFCYPVSDPDLGDIDSTAALLDVAAKYEIKRVAESARARFMLLGALRKNPIRAYFLAIRFNWFLEARLAAILDVLYHGTPSFSPVDEYVPEMGVAPARVYENLRLYRERCLPIVRRVIVSTEPHDNSRGENKLTIQWPILDEVLRETLEIAGDAIGPAQNTQLRSFLFGLLPSTVLSWNAQWDG